MLRNFEYRIIGVVLTCQSISMVGQ